MHYSLKCGLEDISKDIYSSYKHIRSSTSQSEVDITMYISRFSIYVVCKNQNNDLMYKHTKKPHSGVSNIRIMSRRILKSQFWIKNHCKPIVKGAKQVSQA